MFIVRKPHAACMIYFCTITKKQSYNKGKVHRKKKEKKNRQMSVLGR